MMTKKMTLKEKILQAEELGSRYLADANAAAEKGDTERSFRLYDKGQYWLDRLNKLTDNN